MLSIAAIFHCGRLSSLPSHCSPSAPGSRCHQISPRQYPSAFRRISTAATRRNSRPAPKPHASTPPAAIEIAQATAQAGGAIALTYVPGGAHDATSRRLEWQVVGVDLGFTHDVTLNLIGQTLVGFSAGQNVNLRVKTANPAGNTYSAVKTVNTL